MNDCVEILKAFENDGMRGGEIKNVLKHDTSCSGVFLVLSIVEQQYEYRHYPNSK